MAMPRIITSSKFQASFFQSLLISIPLIFTLLDKNLDREHKQQACNIAIIAVAGVWGIAIHATGREDAAKAGANTPSPTTINAGQAEVQTTNQSQPQPQSIVMSDEVAGAIQDIYRQLSQLNAQRGGPVVNKPTNVAAGLKQNQQESGIFREYSQDSAKWNGFHVAPKENRS